MKRAVLLLGLLLACGDDTIGNGTGDMAGQTGSDGGAGACKMANQTCMTIADCCNGLACDFTTHLCGMPTTCKASGAACATATECCSASCVSGTCATACTINGSACTGNAQCCAGNCAAGKCAAIVSGGCSTVGNPCAANTDCCSQNCQGGLCAQTGGTCLATGDTCYRAADCCTLVCNQPNGASNAGTCQAIQTTGSGGCLLDGEPCSDCTSCCSRVCVPTSTGGHVCQPASGCKLEGDICFTSDDCCGGPNTGLPGQGEVTCTPVAGTNFGTCHNSMGNEPEGDICNDMTQQTICGASAQSDCAGCMSPKWQCCKLDPSGVPRCYGGSTQQCPTGYTGQTPCCIAAGDICAFSAECCDGAPCLPGSDGKLRCGSMCVASGGTCRADADCCTGLVCNVGAGMLQGTCGVPPQPDGGVKVNDAGVIQSDGAVNLCSQVGQTCAVGGQQCCTGLVCTATSGAACAAGQTGCSCYPGIG